MMFELITLGKLRVTGVTASFALQGLIRKQDCYVHDLQLRLFDRLVQPVMRYGYQFWGADCAIQKQHVDALKKKSPLSQIGQWC